MTPEKQRIAIAEVSRWAEPDQPDFLNDLNAIDRAVKSLNAVQCFHYSRWLDEVTEPTGEPRFQTWSPVRISHATAAQRAEAFLRTLGKWEDDSR